MPLQLFKDEERGQQSLASFLCRARLRPGRPRGEPGSAGSRAAGAGRGAAPAPLSAAVPVWGDEASSALNLRTAIVSACSGSTVRQGRPLLFCGARKRSTTPGRLRAGPPPAAAARRDRFTLPLCSSRLRGPPALGGAAGHRHPGPFYYPVRHSCESSPMRSISSDAAPC